MKAEVFSDHFYAAGLDGLPERMAVGGADFALSQVLKNDFFAVTATYTRDGDQGEEEPNKVVLKMGRCRSFFGLPLKWLGCLMVRHEMRMLSRVEDIANVPHIHGRVGRCGFVYEYIPGATLDEKPAIPAGFFADLRQLLEAIHERDIAYVDMNKRGNIIVGEDGKPYLIDFQISRHIKTSKLLPTLTHHIRRQLQQADIYHLCKHKKRLQPEQLTDEELAIYKNRTGWIKCHRVLANPFRMARRALLRFLHKNCGLLHDSSAKRTPETDPARWLE